MAPYRGAIAIDADTGRVLFSDNMRRLAYPASVTKLMTFLLVLEDMQAGLYGPNDRAEASALAASMEPSKVDLRPGQSMTIDDLLLCIMVKSANDAAEVLAEHSALRHRRRRGAPTANVPPAELCAEFVERMNRRARELGMRDTRYASPNGLPPPGGSKRGFDVSTAADLVELGKVVVRMPKALSYTKRPWCKVTDGSGKPLLLAAHNYFLPGTKDKDGLGAPVPGCDGLKTGYTAASGSSIMLTASRNGRRVIVVVLGSAGRHNREKAAGAILRDALDAICIW
jgi:D-alanyl-D-alanine carboxypeptidase (penicillin-binding protein 5/6)